MFFRERYDMKVDGNQTAEQVSYSLAARVHRVSNQPRQLGVSKRATVDSRLGLEGLGYKLVNEKWTGSRRVEEVMSEGFSATVEMNGRSRRQAS